jgi:outer membrane protein assembly factor BamE
MNKPAILLAVTVSLTLTACSTILNNIPGVYKLDIEQGNMIDQSMIDQLKPGMTKRQVQFIMGSPMLADSFHDNRWDYLYSKAPGGEDRVQKRVSLFYNGDNLAGMQGDFRPGNLPVVKEPTETTIELPKRDLEKSMWEKFAGLFGMDTTESSSRQSSATPADQGSRGRRR